MHIVLDLLGICDVLYEWLVTTCNVCTERQLPGGGYFNNTIAFRTNMRKQLSACLK